LGRAALGVSIAFANLGCHFSTQVADIRELYQFTARTSLLGSQFLLPVFLGCALFALRAMPILN
jgi:hypothetical protein